MHSRALVAWSAAAVLSLSATVLTMSPASDAAEFTPGNSDPIAFTSGSGGSSSVLVSGTAGTITDVNVQVDGLSHGAPDDVDLELVGPTGAAVALMSDTCAGAPLSDVTLAFDDSATGSLPAGAPCTSGTYRPTDLPPADSFPVLPSASLAAFNGSNPNGMWSLRAVDDNGSQAENGLVARGFKITILTGPFLAVLPGAGTAGPANPNPLNIAVTGSSGLITDLNVTLRGVTHTSVADLDMLLVSPSGRAAWLVSDACGKGVSETLVEWTFDDEAGAPLPASGTSASCRSGTYRTSPYSDGDPDVVGDSVPPGPYATSLNVFDGASPDGNWHLYIQDDSAADGGYLTGASINVKTASRDTRVPRDTTAPQTKLTERPHRTTSRKALFKFESSEARSTFQCKLNRGAWSSCSSPVTLKHLRYGRLRFKVRAIDAAGNLDNTPARARWRVVHP
jgi:subtilisin-like proprotein convertase family protein